MARDFVKATEGVSKPMMDGERHGPRMLIRASALALVVAVVSACSSAEPPSQLPVPEVTWPDSAMAHGLEDSPWVQIIREAEVLSSVAWNNLDYSDPALINAWGYDTVVDELYRDAQLRFVPGMYELSPLAASLLDWGPNPLVILDVADEGTSGVVTACAVNTRKLGSGDIHSVKVSIYEVRDVGDGATEINVKQADPDTRQEIKGGCGHDVIPEVRFDPAPEFPSMPENGIKQPADRKVYEELQASDG